ncbi:MAG: ribosome maturation factor RimP [Acidobacteriota bacterium]
MDVARRVTDLIRAAVEEQAFELVHVEYQARTGSPVLRVYVDRPGGITLDDCAELSRRIGVLLDVEDLIPNQYLLEVSSPGIERPLFSERDYRRFRGREVRLTTVEKVENRRNFKGVIEDVGDGIVRLNCEGRLYEIPISGIKRGNLVYFD